MASSVKACSESSEKHEKPNQDRALLSGVQHTAPGSLVMQAVEGSAS